MFSPFASIVQLRNALYTLGVLRSYRLPAPVISVGNLTVGGTGKTPLVIAIAQVLSDMGERVCILTRGYGRKSPTSRVVVADGGRILAGAGEAGDEPREMAERLGGAAVIIADPDRASAGRFAAGAYSPTVFILDDGFQHRRLTRDLDIVCVDATEDVFGMRLLPLGKLREPVANIRRAGLIVITRANLVPASGLERLAGRLRAAAPGTEVVTCRNRFTRLRDASSGEECPVERDRVFAFCGLGNPGSFFRQLEDEGYGLLGTHTFRDHHEYSQRDADEICRLASSCGAAALLTTAKDAVKLRSLKFGIPCLYAELSLDFENGADLRGALEKSLRR